MFGCLSHVQRLFSRGYNMSFSSQNMQFSPSTWKPNRNFAVENFEQIAVEMSPLCSHAMASQLLNCNSLGTSIIVMF